MFRKLAYILSKWEVDGIVNTVYEHSFDCCLTLLCLSIVGKQSWRNQKNGKQKPKIEEGQTRQWKKGKWQNTTHINVKQTNVTTDNFCCSNHKLTITGCIIGNNQQTGTVLVVCYLLVSIPMKHCFYNG
jgi:type II secretory pathway component PulC